MFFTDETSFYKSMMIFAVLIRSSFLDKADGLGMGSIPHSNDLLLASFRILSAMDASLKWSDIICALLGLSASRLYPFSI